MIKLLIVDDHPVVREGMEAMLLSERDFRVVGLCADGDEAMAFCRDNDLPDLVLMDVRMPKHDGFETLRAMRSSWPGIRVMLLAGLPNMTDMDLARQIGAVGYLPKSINHDRLVAALRGAVEDGDSFACWESSAQMRGILSARETEILGYLSKGKTREEVGIILGIALETVKSHVTHIMQKLDVVNIVSAVARGYELGILRI